jgi:hypothetical protein
MSAMTSERAIRLVIYDNSGRGLSRAWWAGTYLYRALGRIERARGVSSWREGLSYLDEIEPGARIDEVQFWGHGKWGDARVGSELIDERALVRGHALNPLLSTLRARLSDEALFWFRTCETFGAERGQRFARAFADFMGCRVAGHTYVIAVWQSGLHTLDPGAEPNWDPAEGLRQGNPARPLVARQSTPFEPNTITCFDGRIPEKLIGA